MATYKVGKDGKAQSGLKAGDVVVTGGGTYTITGVNADGSYKSTLTDKNTTTSNYKGSYASTGSSTGGGKGGSTGSAGGKGGGQYTGSSASSGSGYYSPKGGGSGGYVPKGDWEGDRMQSQAVQDQLQGYRDQFLAAQQAGDQAGMDAAHAAAEALRGQYGYSGGSDGSEYLPFGQNAGKFSYGPAPTYSDPYTSDIDRLVDAILNRDDFSYDATKDPLYAQYKDQYQREGQRAMEDTLGQVSARTGGLASSYATTASQQANQYYAQQLADKIPELYQLAYQMYLDDIDLKAQDLGLLQSVSNTAYNRYRDTMNDWRADRDFAYGQYRDDIADNRYESEWDYGVGRDQVDDERYESSQAYQKATDLLSAGIMPDEALLKQAGISAQQAAAWIAGQKRSYSGSGGGYGGGSGEDDYDGLFAAARQSGTPKSYIANHYKEYGFSSQSGLYEKYSAWNEDLEGTQWGDYSREILERAKHETMPQEVIDASIQLAIQEGRISEDEAEKLYLMLSL